jgi:hypothetical protein
MGLAVKTIKQPTYHIFVSVFGVRVEWPLLAGHSYKEVCQKPHDKILHPSFWLSDVTKYEEVILQKS